MRSIPTASYLRRFICAPTQKHLHSNLRFLAKRVREVYAGCRCEAVVDFQPLFSKRCLNFCHLFGFLQEKAVK
jgi:hypothetical protein